MRWPHSLVLIQDAQAVDVDDNGLEDDYGHPLPADPTETKFRGWIQPTSSIEAAQANEAGEAATRFLLFAPITLPVTKDDRIRWDAEDDSRIYQIEGQPLDAAGRRHHLEIALRVKES